MKGEIVPSNCENEGVSSASCDTDTDTGREHREGEGGVLSTIGEVCHRGLSYDCLD
jgi:hypothetical protein